MKWIPGDVRLTACLISLMMSLIFFTVAVDILPDPVVITMKGRKSLCEGMAIQCSHAVQSGNFDSFRLTIEGQARRNPELLSVGVRRVDDSLQMAVGEHEALWRHAGQATAGQTHLRIPLTRQGDAWGSFEVVFAPIAPHGIWAMFGTPMTVFFCFISLTGSLVYFLFIRFLFRGLSQIQSGTVPRRVRMALNTMAEGVVILDNQQRIVLANQAFSEFVGEQAEKLEGKRVSDMPWCRIGFNDHQEALPWERSLKEGTPRTKSILKYDDKPHRRESIYSVNSMPILGDDGTQRGALATFDNLTELERKNTQLKNALKALGKKKEEIRSQNQQLLLLATRDPMTGCLNRRAFFEHFEKNWTIAQHQDLPLSAILVDVDHFKSVNDNHGHAVGDKVLQQVAEILKTSVRSGDIVCRFGGEEFCVLLPNTPLEGGMHVAELLRHTMESTQAAGLKITASFGVSAISEKAKSPSDLLDQADKALYAGKHRGRNCVVSWREIAHLPELPKKKGREEEKLSTNVPVPIPFHAVTALFTALAHRHADTAEHSRRVADLCVATARKLMSQSDCYILEVAGLLHDIGKLGVPDAVLLKPGPLTKDEWKIIRTHEHIGEEIIASAFSSKPLSDIIAKHHAWYSGTPFDPQLPKGEDIPIGARILTIADAYDAMVSDRCYRKGRPREEAFQELRRCGGTQFDSVLVERFIAAVLERDDARLYRSVSMNKETALRIGMQIEKLAIAMDSGDITTLHAMASQIHATAKASGIEELAKAAARLENSAHHETEILGLSELTLDLLELCRASYNSCLPHADESSAHKSVEPIKTLVGV